MKLTEQQLKDWVNEVSEEMESAGSNRLLTMDGFDDCIAGVVQRFTDTFVVYDEEKVLRKLVERDGMSEEEAEEFWHTNQLLAWHGTSTVGFLYRPPEND